MPEALVGWVYGPLDGLTGYVEIDESGFPPAGMEHFSVGEGLEVRLGVYLLESVEVDGEDQLVYVWREENAT